MDKNRLLCDFHIHTDMSDSDVPLQEAIDLFVEKGQRRRPRQ